MNGLGRWCDCGALHPAEIEQRAAEIQHDVTGVWVGMPAGSYVREACAELYERCPLEQVGQ